MNSLMILIYLSAIGVSSVLRIQEKKHNAETALECTRLGLPLPSVRPKIQTLEALLNIAIGFVMLVPAALAVWGIFTDPWLRAHTGPEMGDAYGLLLATGVTLIFLGSKALRQNLLHRRNAGQSGEGGPGKGRIQ